MANPFYVKLGFSNDEIASVVKVFGIDATMAGIAAGGVFAYKLGLARALVAAGLVHARANLAFILQAYAGPNVPCWGVTIFVENFTGGLVGSGVRRVPVDALPPGLHRDAVRAALVADRGRARPCSRRRRAGSPSSWAGPLFFGVVRARGAAGNRAGALCCRTARGVQLLRRNSANEPKSASSP